MAFLTKKEHVGRALDRLKDALAKCVEQRFRNEHGDRALIEALKYFKQIKEANQPFAKWDARWLLILMRDSWEDMFADLGTGVLSLVNELHEARTRWAHQRDFSGSEAGRVCDAADGLVEAISSQPGPRLLRLFDARLDEERCDPSWPDVLDRLWPWRGDYYTALETGENFFSVAFGLPDHHQGISLHLLSVDDAYHEVHGGTAGAAAILNSVRNRNGVVCLAPDQDRLADLRESVLRYRAWEELLHHEPDLTAQEQDAARSCLEQAQREVERQLIAAYRWLLVPTQTGPESPVEWNVIRLEPSLDPVERAWHALERAGGVTRHLDTMRLTEVLELVPAWRTGPHLKISDLAREFSRHPYLPRLVSQAVLDKAIAEALGTPGLASFAYAICHEAEGYAGLYRPGSGERPMAGLLMNRVGFLVRPQAIA